MMPSLAVVAGALLLRLGSAAPPRAPARGGIKLSSCPRGGSSPAAAHDDREAGIETFARDYEISTSYENGSTCAAQAGENGLDGAFPKALATSAAARNTWLQLYKNYGADGLYADAFDSETIKGAATAELVANKFQAGGVHALHAIEQIAAPDATKGGVDVLDVASAELAPTPGTTMQFMAPDATKGGVDGEAAAQSYLGRVSWCLFQVLASVVPRRSSSAMGAAWHSSVVGYLLIWGDVTRVAAETSVRGRSGRSDDNTKSKTMTKTNNPQRAPAGGLTQRRALTGYVMDDDSIRTAVAAWVSDAATAEAMYGHISTWETSGVTDMSYLFCVRQDWMDRPWEHYDDKCFLSASFNEDIGAWDTSGVTSMYWMFYVASAFNQDIGGWSVEQVTDMHSMFHSASSFNQNIGAWRVEQVTNMHEMFEGAAAFNRDIGGWAVHSVTDMGGMFKETSAFNQDIGAWDTSGVMSMHGMFDHASSFNQNIGGWSVDNVYEMGQMFNSASAFDQDISAWSVENVRDMHGMFDSASAFDQDLGWCVDDDVNLERAFEGTRCASTSCGVVLQGVDCPFPTPAPTQRNFMDDSRIRTAVRAWMEDRAAAEATYGHISTWETSGVTDMSHLFCVRQDWMEGDSGKDDCVSEASFNEDIGAWDTSGVTRMYGMFWGASSFNQNIGGWNVENVYEMGQMFNSASSFNQDIGGWRVEQVRDMHWMLGWASSFNQDLGWCVDNDVNLDEAFSGTPCASTSCGIVRGRSEGGICVTLAPTFFDGAFGDESIRTAVRAWMEDSAAAEATYGHISTWETSGVTDMSWLFCGDSHDHSGVGYCNTAAASFNENIGAWDTSGVTRMHGMFWYASSFNQNIGGWSVDYVYEMSQMFNNARAFNQDIGGWRVDNIRDMTAMFAAASSFNQNIGGWSVENVTSMQSMFHWASAFDQDLGWCVGDDVNLDEAFSGSGCCSTSCGVAQQDETGACQIIDSWDCYYYYDDDDDDDGGGTELVMSGGLVAIGITFTGLTIAAIANAVQEQCALGPTIVYEAGTTHPYYISPNLCTIGTKTYASKTTVRDASPRKVCRKFCEAASEKGKLALKHVQGLTCYCKRR